MHSSAEAMPAASQRVAVLGAGLAGLAAAWELAEAGREVVVLEARERAGGRVETLREGFSHGLYADAGAMAFSDAYRELFRFADLLGLKTVPLAARWRELSRGAEHYHLRGRQVLESADGAVDWPLQLDAEERKLGRWGIVERHLVSAASTELPADPATLPAWAAAFDGQTVAELMRRQGASEGAIELVRSTVWFGEAVHRVSAAACLLSDVAPFFLGQGEHTFAGGVERLPRAMAKRLGDRVVYGAEVVRLRSLADRVEIAFRRRGVTDSLSAAGVVCALPPTVLRSIGIEPAFSEARGECLRGLAYAPVTRVFVQVRRRLWEARGLRSMAYTDLPIQRVLEQPLVPPAAAGERTLLEAHVGGEAALQLDRLASEERLALVVRELERVHPGVGGVVEGSAVKSWADDPWARGAYALFGPGELGRWLPLLQQPEGRIHFAGEHTSRLSGTLEGALESGVRAARRLLASN